jgi:response regulator RpfG family c-di-GMP phosphodiesterase
MGNSTAEIHSPKIIMVNDEPYVLEALEMMLRLWFKNATILMFNVPEEALEELLRSDPDLLITDDKMPRMDGYEIVGRLADSNVTYPIIVTSPWSPTEAWVREWANYGLNISYLAQPFTVEELKGELTKHNIRPEISP